MFAANVTDRAGVVLEVSEIAPTLDFLTDVVGFRVETIFPADDPRRCTLIGFGCRLHLELGTPRPMTLRLEVADPTAYSRSRLLGPNDLRVDFVEARPEMTLPPLVSSFSLTHAAETWHTGRAGMNYRDLIPDRQGGAVIASHIRIPGAGPVPDYVHFHDIAFQLIFCRRGRVTVVYEDQGEPFVLEAGDCVTQPPQIRHRVLESSDDLEVIEIGYPAEHITRADPTVSLPTGSVDRRRTWNGQTFVHHRRDLATPVSVSDGVALIETGVAAGTQNLADVSQIDIDSSTWSCPVSGEREFVMLFCLDGRGTVHIDGVTQPRNEDIDSGSTLVIPVGHRATVMSEDRLSLLQVRIRTL